jgi:hypothetical protein
MDAFITIGGVIMGVNPWESGRNLERMGLQGLDRDGILEYLYSGVRKEAGR